MYHLNGTTVTAIATIKNPNSNSYLVFVQNAFKNITLVFFECLKVVN